MKRKMEQRTLNIINVCKGHSKYWEGTEDTLQAVKNYMADECGCKVEWYTEKQITDIMYTAMKDYIDCCDKPSFFLYNLERVHVSDPSNLTERIAFAFSIVEVRDKEGNYINGFDERLNKLDKNEVI